MHALPAPMSDTATLNFLWSQALVAGLHAAGVRDAVISPGSRSTPLALALLRQDGFTCHVAVDERAAAFFALGLARASGQPAVLLATSGTAPANWLPAVVEASLAGVPMLLFSADRPPELHGCGANQTVEQAAMFAPYVRASHAPGAPAAGFDPAWLHRLAARAVEQATWPHPGPVHVNQPFREPLVPSGAELPRPSLAPIVVDRPRLLPDDDAVGDLARCLSGRRGVIVCGEQPFAAAFPGAVAALAARLDSPILAEPLSNLRFGAHDRSRLLVRYNLWLGDIPAVGEDRPEWVLRFGAWPVTRNLQDYVAAVAEHIVVDPWPRWSDPAHRVTRMLRADPASLCLALLAQHPAPAPSAWRARLAVRELGAQEAATGRYIGRLIDVLPDGHAVFVGNSLAIRQLDSYAGTGGKTLRFFGNRGASGIDGNVSTALGISAAAGPLVALIGDLTLQHDLGGLALAGGLDAVIVAVNNGGGGIFDHLPQSALPEFVCGWRTPQDIDFAAAANTFGLRFAACDTPAGLAAVVGAAIVRGGPHLVEYRVRD
jgi:2-succinyl-5-enolpyruvyl-6-hydroxy-3-cyclohexene-1-carboxylate synthase